MESQNDRTLAEEPQSVEEPQVTDPPPRVASAGRFRIEKLEERIAPRKGGGESTRCGGVGGVSIC